MARRFSLGAAILGTKDSAAHVPDAWRAALLKALDGPSRASVAQSCKSGWQLLVDEWPEAELTVSVRASTAERLAVLMRRLKSARQQVQQRRGKPTVLVLKQCGDLDAEDQCWEVALETLSAAGTRSNLTLSLQFQSVTPQLIACAASAFPKLKSLSIGSPVDEDFVVELPAPEVLPALRHLTIHKVALSAHEGLWASLKPLLPQLVSLTIHKQPTDRSERTDDLWHSLFVDQRQPRNPRHQPDYRAKKLKQLTVPGRLTPDLMALLQHSAPSVEELTVTVLDSCNDRREPLKDDYSYKVLRISLNDTFPVSILDWLPLPKDGKLAVDLGGTGTIAAYLSIGDKEARLLKRINFTGWTRLQLSMQCVRRGDEGRALRAALPHIAHLQSPKTELVLHQLRVNNALSAELHTAVKAWPKLSLTKVTDWHKDVTPPLPPLHTFADRCQSVPPLTMFSRVDILGLKWMCRVSDLPPPGAAVPWGTTKGYRHEIELSKVLEAVAQGYTTAWDLQSMGVELTVAQIDAGEHVRMAEQLRGVRISRVGDLKLCLGEDTSAADKQRILRAELEIIQALSCTLEWLSIRHFVGTEGLVSELANIPHWVNLALHTPEPGKDAPTPDVWPLSRALSMVPSTYRTVRLWAQQELDQELEAFVLGAPSSRTAGNPLVIELNTADEYEDSDGSLMSRKVAALSRRVKVPYVSLRPFPLCW